MCTYQSGRDGIAPLLEVDVAVPPPPDLGGGEHTTATAHVTEGTLARALGTTTTDTGDTGDGTTGTPRLGRCLHTNTRAQKRQGMCEKLGYIRVI